VARFVGSANVAEGSLAQRISGEAKSFAVRAEHVRLLGMDERIPDNFMRCEGTVLDVQYHGALNRWQVSLDGGAVFAANVNDAPGIQVMHPGERVQLAWSRADAVPLAGE
jgi:putative spermidine/putrescine transport system ATP-binding protein